MFKFNDISISYLKFTTLLLFFALTMQFCKSVEKSTDVAPEDTAVEMTSYETDIAPILKTKCSPCHFPKMGREKILDNFHAVRDNLDNIIYLVQLPQHNERFMPFKSKKEPLTKEEIKTLKKWRVQDTPR